MSFPEPGLVSMTVHPLSTLVLFDSPPGSGGPALPVGRSDLSSLVFTLTSPWTTFTQQARPCLVLKKFCKIFQIFRHIESLDVCIEY